MTGPPANLPILAHGASSVIISGARPRDRAAGTTLLWGHGGHVAACVEVTREKGT